MQFIMLAALGYAVWRYWPQLAALFNVAAVSAAAPIPSAVEARAALAAVKLRILATGVSDVEAAALCDPLAERLR